MTYQVLARKWRPQAFDELIGQEAVVTALLNSLREGRIAQAYLFSGIRGVGKTTAARLFAKALNCESAAEARPCNRCTTCAEITAGADLDVLEIDAATYSKVEQVRELAESLKYGPSRDRHKVVILDEVHRLSRQAFDALLKIVEEPPPRLVFVFATTEIDAVPATILSRCQEYHFRRVGAKVVADHLAKICQQERIAASERALRLIARAGEGSVRDAVALLDQLATFGQGTIDEQEAQRLVGGLDLALFAELLGAILGGDAARVSALARNVEAAGWDPRQVYAHFLAYCRDGLHLALGGDGAALELPEEEARALAELARGAGYENLLRLLHQLLASEVAVRRSDAGALALEIAWLRAAELPKLIAIERVLSGGVPPAAAPAPARPAPAPTPLETRTPASAGPAVSGDPPRRKVAPAAPVDALTPLPLAAPAPVAAPAPAVAPAGVDAADGIERLREELSLRRPMLAAQLAAASFEMAAGELRIALPAGDALAAQQLQRAANREALDAAVVGIFGTGTRWRQIERAAPKAPTRPAASESGTRPGEESANAAAADPRVQAVLDIFGGTLKPVGPVVDEAESEENG
jgi:DNA polymerase-3 subunit gamma/tau